MDGCRHLFIDVHLPTTMHTLEEFKTAICDVDDLIASAPGCHVVHFAGDFNAHLQQQDGVVGSRVPIAAFSARAQAVAELFRRHNVLAANTFDDSVVEGERKDTLFHRPTQTLHLNDYIGINPIYLIGNDIRVFGVLAL